MKNLQKIQSLLVGQMQRDERSLRDWHMELLWLPLSYLTTLYLLYVIHCWQLFISLWRPLWIHYVKGTCMQWPWTFLFSPCRHAIVEHLAFPKCDAYCLFKYCLFKHCLFKYSPFASKGCTLGFNPKSPPPVSYYCRWFVFPEAWWKGICT